MKYRVTTYSIKGRDVYVSESYIAALGVFDFAVWEMNKDKYNSNLKNVVLEKVCDKGEKNCHSRPMIFKHLKY